MKQKLIITTLAICLITVGCLTANATQGYSEGYGPLAMSKSEDGEHEGRGMHRRYQQEMITELLGLTEEQQSAIKEIRKEERDASKSMREKLREYQEQMRELTDAGTFDENAVRAIAEEKAKIQVELAVTKARGHSKIHAIMTPEQQALAQKIRSLKHGKKGKHQRGEGGGWRPDFD